MTTFAFQPSSTGPTSTSHPAPEPGREGPGPLPDREWGLSASQVVAVVLAIVAACELIGAWFP